MFTTSELLERINSHIKGLSYVRVPYGLYEPVTYVLSLGGKRLRPLLMLMSYNLYRDDLERVLSPATGIEIYHNYTLLHDDLMDNADLRRGKPTVHRVWDRNVAILAGDTMFALACRYMAQCPQKHLKRVFDWFNEMALQICEGQQLDMEFESRKDVSENEYLNMIRLKTSVLLANSLAIGALIGEAPEEDIKRLYDFGINLGMAFQLKDDLLDVYGDTAVFGKNIGGDILCNKKTYLLINALQRADAVQRDALNTWLEAETYVSEEKITSVTAIYDAIGIKDLCENKIIEYSKHAEDNLAGISVLKDNKCELKKLMEQMMFRTV